MERITVLLALMSLDAGGAETHVISLANQLKKWSPCLGYVSRGKIDISASRDGNRALYLVTG